MKRAVFFLFISMLTIIATASKPQNFKLLSPDKNIEVAVDVDKSITYNISYKGTKYIQPSAISMKLEGGEVLGENPSVRKTSTKSVDNIISPLYGINKKIKNHFNELRIDFKNQYSLVFRLYDEGFAWRFETNIKGNIIVESEQADFCFTDNYTAYFHPTISESMYRIQKISDAKQDPNYSTLPILVKPAEDVNILIHESDVLDFPCLNVKSHTESMNTLKGTHPLYPIKTEAGGHMNFNQVVLETEKYVAETQGKRTFPWRIIAFEDNDQDIMNNQLVYLLASDTKIVETGWIKPGKVAWDWWSALNLTGVPFEAGFNTETYKYYIDFAAQNNIEYINLDEGWSDQFDLMKITDKIDMPEIMNYAKSKNIGVFLWCVWWTLDRQMIEALDQFEKWGVAGIKVDFMDRDDQVVVNFHERLLAEAAKRKIIVNFHGAYHPTGMERTYPNLINTEGVRGLEWNKFDKEGTPPQHDVTIPFIRMFAGSMDYTPGALENYNKQDWKMIGDRPKSQGTRSHQLAMFVIYYGALQMLSDTPTAYEREPQILDFISDVPSIWDETYPLNSRIGEYVSLARRKNQDWYVGGMTNWDSRDVSISLDFLEQGKTYEAKIFTDGANSHKVGNDYAITSQIVKKGDVLNLKLASGGGYAMKLTELR